MGHLRHRIATRYVIVAKDFEYENLGPLIFSDVPLYLGNRIWYKNVLGH